MNATTSKTISRFSNTNRIPKRSMKKAVKRVRDWRERSKVLRFMRHADLTGRGTALPVTPE